ncbi:MAG: DsbA family protein [Alphaproteobacteria bacterium]
MMRVVLLMVFALCAAAPTWALNKADKAEVNQLIQAYIQQHPAEMMTAMAKYQQQMKVKAAAALIDAHTPVSGSANAPITIIEFSEFECPFCGRAQPTLQALREKYKGKIRFAYKHMPLSFHKNAMPAAQAAQAAHMQGKFWEFSQDMWQNQSRLSDKLYVQTAEKLGLNMAKFNADRASSAVAKIVADAQESGAAMGVQGTPHFLVNGEELSGAQPLEAFVAIIDSLLAAQK